MNFDSWMEDRINGDYGPELDRLDSEEQFQLQPPSGSDDLDEATTNDESSIEIEIVDEGSLLLGHIRGANEGYDGERWASGYEPYEPNPYHGTYSEM